MPKDGLQALVCPPVLTTVQVDSINREPRKKYLVPGERVIGVSLNGSARAYPVSLLNWHEVVNDTIGGVPLVITWNPLCGAAAVFDRRIADETMQFGVSGLLYNSNLLMYDRREGGVGESLWSQLLGCAVSGPAVEREAELKLLPTTLTTWKIWLALFPETGICDRVPEKIKLYKKRPYTTYVDSKKLRFPVQPLPPEGGPPLKSNVVAVHAGGEERVFGVESLRERAGESGVWNTRVGGEPVGFRVAGSPSTVVIRSGESGLPLPVVYSFWFARYAMFPETVLE